MGQASGAVLSQGKPAGEGWGVVSRRGLSGGASPLQGEGRDGRTSPAQATSAGHWRTGPPCANRPAGESQQSTSGQAPPGAGSVSVPGCAPAPSLLGCPAQGRRPWGRPRNGRGVWRASAGHHGGMGTAPASTTLPGHSGPTLCPSQGTRDSKATRHTGARRYTGAPGLCDAVDGHLCAGCSGVQCRLATRTRGVGCGQSPHLRSAIRPIGVSGGRRYPRRLRPDGPRLAGGQAAWT